MATSRDERDKYRSVLNDVGDVQWRYGHPPAFDLVNQLFEEGQTKVLGLYIYNLYVSFMYVVSKLKICESDSLLVFGFDHRYGQKDPWKRRFKTRSSHGRWSSHTRSVYKTSRL